MYLGPHYVVFPLLVGWLRWKFCTDRGNVYTAPDTGIDPLFACEPLAMNRHELFVEAISLDHIHPRLSDL